MAQEIFKRYEKKYKITLKQYQELGIKEKIR